MAVCDLNSALLQIQRSTKRLQESWFETKESWNDPVSREFQEKFLEPILPELQVVVGAAQDVSELLIRAERDCRDPKHAESPY